MLRRIGLACATLFVASGAVADTLADCTQSRNPELRLRACSEVISNSKYGAEDKALAYRNRGAARADAGATAQAVADFSEAIKLLPTDASSYAGRGLAKLGLGDATGAIGDYGEALRLKPDGAAFLAGRGHAHFIKGDQPAAIADFTEVIRLNPNSASALNRRGLAYRRSGDLARAIDDYTAAIMINPIYALAYNNRGYAYEALGRKDEAIADFQSALLLDASLVGARDGLVRLGFPAGWLIQTQERIQEGKALVEKNCSPCHAVGATGASPNGKAPEFRNLHARHPSLALREPLSRGIAAPHDEMPRFGLTETQTDSIVAYINSLSTPEARTAKAKTPLPVAEAVDIGDVRRGLDYAKKVCAECHNVLGSHAPSPNRQAPPFKKIANTPGMSVTALTVWSRTTHPTMPNLIIEPGDMDDLIAYLLSLKERK
jgi:tetratricopeptide (TPR) repeat protein